MANEEITETTGNFGTTINTQHYDFDAGEWKKWCRLCAKFDGQCLNIITGLYQPTSAWAAFTSCVQRSIDIVQIIEEFLRVRIAEDDKLSQFICAECFKAVNTMLEFRERVYKVQKMFIDLQNGDHTCTQVNRKVLYEKYNLMERYSFFTPPSLQNAPTAGGSEANIPLEEIFMPDLSCGNTSPNSLHVQVKNEKKLDELLSAEVLLIERKGKSYDPFSDEGYDNEEYKPTNSKAKRRSKRKVVKTSDKKKMNSTLKTKKGKLAQRQEQQQALPDESVRENNDANDNSNKKTKRKSNRQVVKKKDEKKMHPAPKTKKCKSAECQDQQEQQFDSDDPDWHYDDTNDDETNDSDDDDEYKPNNNAEKKKKKPDSKTKEDKSEIQQPFVCEVCGLIFKHKWKLSEHLLLHTEGSPFECKECGKNFKNKGNLLHHKQIHGNKHICPVCGKQLNTRRTLRNHLRIHSDKMDHKCDFCGRLFKHKNNLKNHLIAHTNLRPYCCDFCGKRFSTGPSCRFHKKTMHPKELAEFEASGAKVYTKNIPPLHLLKEVSKTGENFKPLASKQTGCVKFDTGIQQLQSEATNLCRTECQPMTE